MSCLSARQKIEKKTEKNWEKLRKAELIEKNWENEKTVKTEKNWEKVRKSLPMPLSLSPMSWSLFSSENSVAKLSNRNFLLLFIMLFGNRPVVDSRLCYGSSRHRNQQVQDVNIDPWWCVAKRASGAPVFRSLFFVRTSYTAELVSATGQDDGCCSTELFAVLGSVRPSRSLLLAGCYLPSSAQARRHWRFKSYVSG